MTETAHKVGSKLPKPNNIITVSTKGTLDFFKWWCALLRPFVQLSNREIDVVSNYLKQRYELSKVISDQAVLDSQLMSNTIRDKILTDCKMSLQHFYVIVNSLKKNGVITENGINPRLIPNIDAKKDDKGIFQLLILFKDVS